MNAIPFRVLPLAMLIVSGCATPLLDSGRAVALVGPLSASEVGNYQELGPVKCTELSRLPDIDESCRNQLRNKAAQLGAEIVVVESRDKTDCWPEHSSDCLEMTGRAYRKIKAPASAPQT